MRRIMSNKKPKKIEEEITRILLDFEDDNHNSDIIVCRESLPRAVNRIKTLLQEKEKEKEELKEIIIKWVTLYNKMADLYRGSSKNFSELFELTKPKK